MKRAALLAILLPAACAGLLGLRARGPHPFEHRAHVVAGVSCTTCHPGVQAATDDGPLHLPGGETCASCHPRPHDPRPCLTCHTTPFAAIGAQDARRHLRFEHRDHAGASRGNCMRCHVGVAEGDARLRPPMAACGGCHQHEEALRGRDCDACHVDLAEEGTLPESHLVHDGNFAREHGTRAASSGDLCASCHSERFCASCHGVTTPGLPARLRFDEPDRASVHRANFLARHSLEARAEPGTCATCHAEETCRSCHVASGVAGQPGAPAADPHPPGWVGPTRNDHGPAARRDPVSCASCHGGAGEALCVSCHRVGGVGGSPHPPGWSSQLSRREQPCRMCHLP